MAFQLASFLTKKLQAINKKSNLETYFSTKHAQVASKYAAGEERKKAVDELQKQKQQSSSMLSNWTQSTSNVNPASLMESLEITKKGKPFTDEVFFMAIGRTVGGQWVGLQGLELAFWKIFWRKEFFEKRESSYWLLGSEDNGFPGDGTFWSRGAKSGHLVRRGMGNENLDLECRNTLNFSGYCWNDVKWLCIRILRSYFFPMATTLAGVAFQKYDQQKIALEIALQALRSLCEMVDKLHIQHSSCHKIFSEKPDAM
ncbi:SCAN domain-containing protein 3 [Trichonephila clavipes]|nr:SCAN domain-containing protein 3 [Trichonephila clavipes]